MPNESLYLAKSSLAYAKLVATPTATSWSQVYNAGNLFACISLSHDPQDEEHSLPALGKTIFSNLEAEFFTLDKKDLENIKEAIQNSLQNIPSSIKVSLCLSFFKEDILYLFIAGAGKAVMKRGDKIGVLLEQKHGSLNEIITASGYLQNEDSVVLETIQFAEDVSDETLASAFELALPNDIAEALSPQIIEKNDGGQAAIIIAYHGVAKAPVEEEPEEIPQEEEELPIRPAFKEESEFYEPKEAKRKLPSLPSFRLPKFHLGKLRLNHSKKIYLTIAVILIGLIISSVYFSKQKEENTKTRQLFQSIYEPAQKKYDDGKSLQNLNKSLSNEDFVEARDILKQADGKFKPGSTEDQKIQSLKQKIDAEIGSSSVSSGISAKEAAADASDILAAEKNNKNTLGASQDADSVYLLNNKVINAVDKNSGKNKELIKNDGDWDKPVGVATYLGNLYVLDQKNGIIKYVAGADGYGKSSYFSGQSPNLGKAVALAIDSSVYVLQSDGTIQKFTRGAADTFKLTGLDNPLRNPVKIFTDIDTDNLYVLDKGNGRVVKLSKTGEFQKAYQTTIAAQADDFEVKESDLKVLFLANDKIWEIPL